MKKYLLFAALLAISWDVQALSIVYEGKACASFGVNPFLDKRSKFEVSGDLGDGNILLTLTEGVPIFKEETCVGSLGNIASEETEFQIVDAQSIEAVARFDNNNLIITFAYFLQVSKPEISQDIATSGVLSPQVRMFVFDYIEARQSFKLISVIKQSGLVSLFGIPDIGAFTNTLNYSPVEFIQVTDDVEYFILE